MSEARRNSGLPRFGARRRGARGRREPLPLLARPRVTREPRAEAPWFPRRRRDTAPLPWGLALSALLHGLVLAVLLLELWPGGRREETPLPPPAIDVVFESGQPEPQAGGAPEGEAPDAVEPPARAEAPPPAPDIPTPPQHAVPPAPPAPPSALPPPPQLAMPLPPIPPPPVPQPPRQAPPPPAPPLAQTPLPPAAPPLPEIPALAGPPPRPPEPVPRLSAESPATQLPPDLLAPPTPLALSPPRQELTPQPRPRPTPPPRPAQQAQPTPRLPGMVLPEGFNLSQPRPAPGRPIGPRAPLDLSADPRFLEGRTSSDPVVQVRGAQVGPNWSNAFRRWLDQNLRYPPQAAIEGDSGTVRVRITASPDGTVRSVRILQQSASPWLNSGTTRPFAGARLPAFPPGADPNGVEVDLTVNYFLIRR